MNQKRRPVNQARTPVNPNVVIWTRGREDWNDDLRTFPSALRKAILHLPCTEVTSVMPPEHTLNRVRKAVNAAKVVILCTSPKSGHFALNLKSASKFLRRASAWMTFGTATAQFLRGQGLRVTRPQNCHSSADLFHHIVSRARRVDTFIVLRAKQPAFDLGKALREASIAAIDLALYETQSKLTQANGKAVPEELRRKVSEETMGVVAFASPSAVRGFVQGMKRKAQSTGGKRRKGQWRKNFVAVCIGSTTAAEAQKYFVDVRVAKKSTIAELVRAAHLAIKSLKSPR